jgi:flagellar M-ring protein FliF
MESLNRAAAQLRELFLSMTPGARLTAALLLIVVVVSLTYLFKGQAGSTDTYLMGGEYFESDDVKAMLAAFGQADLNDYELEGNRIRIPASKKHVYMAALADAGAMPPSFGSYLQKALDGGSIFMTKDEEQSRLRVARQNELNLILREMDGIEKASVLTDVKKSGGLSREDILTATVAIKPTSGEQFDNGRLLRLRHLVAGAVAGLKPENVTVTDTTSGRTLGGGGDAPVDPVEDAYYSRKQHYERSVEQQIRELLAAIPNVVVKVNAELDTEMNHVEESLKHDEKAVPQQTLTKTVSTTNESTTPGGRIGLAAQGPGATPVQQSASRTTKSTEDITDDSTSNLVGGTRITREVKGLTPKQARAAIAIPSDYFVQVWRENNPPAEGAEPVSPDAAELTKIKEAEITKIEEAVASLLPTPPAGVDPLPRVTVTTFQSLSAEPIEEPSFAQNALAWTGQYGGTLSMMGLAVFGLVMLRSLVRSVPYDAPPASAPTLSVVHQDSEPEEEQASKPRVRRKSAHGPSLKEDLTEMVHEDPDAAAAILRNWIGNVG